MLLRLFLFLTIFLPIYTLYLKTMPPTVFWQDSGIYLAGLKTFGIIYPPGFPLYMLLGVLWLKIISFLPLSLNFAQMVHAFSGLWGAGAAALMGLAVYELTSSAGGGRGPSTRAQAEGGPPLSARRSTLRPRTSDGGKARQDPSRIIISFISGLAAGASYSLWAQAINAEVYSLVGFFAAALFFLVVKMVKDYRKPPFDKNDFQKIIKVYRKYLFLIAFFWGLSFGVHLLTITFLLPLLYLFFSLRLLPFFKAKILNPESFKPFLDGKAWILAFLIFLFSAFVPYLYLPIRSSASPAVAWSKIDSPQAFFSHITGESYRTAESAISPPSPEKLRSYPILFWEEFFLLGALFGLLGFWVLYKKKNDKLRSFAFFGAFQAIIIYLLISFYERGTEYNLWLIPFYLYWNVLAGFGLWKVAKKISFWPARAFLLFVFSLGLLGPQLWINWPLLNRSNYVLAEEFGKNLIGKLPQQAVFFTMGDQESSIPAYLQQVLGYRRDLAITSDSDFTATWRRRRLAHYRPDLKIPALEGEDRQATPEELTQIINDFVRTNLEKNLFVITKNYLPLSPEFKLIPAGTIWQIKKAEEPEIIDLAFWQYSFSDPNRYRKPERPELSRKKTNYVKGQAVVTYERAPYSDEAKVFELQAKKNLGDLCHGSWREKKIAKVKTLTGQLETWQEDKLIQCALSSYEAMFKIDPNFYHREVFLNLAELYQKMGRDEEAKRLIKRLEENR